MWGNAGWCESGWCDIEQASTPPVTNDVNTESWCDNSWCESGWCESSITIVPSLTEGVIVTRQLQHSEMLAPDYIIEGGIITRQLQHSLSIAPSISQQLKMHLGLDVKSPDSDILGNLYAL